MTAPPSSRSGGWPVVGIDFVPAAIAAARRRAEQAGVEIELVEGDTLDHPHAQPTERPAA